MKRAGARGNGGYSAQIAFSTKYCGLLCQRPCWNQ